jgi:xanthine dehydrogenase accessory factor
VKVLKAALAARQQGRPAAMVTVIGIAGSAPRTSGSKMLVYADGEIVGTIGGGAFEHKAIDAAINALKSGLPSRFSANLSRDLGMCCGGEMEAYIEPLECIVDLVIYGAGHVGAATAALANTAGFRVSLVDERPELTEEESHSPDVRVICGDPLRQLDTLPWGMGTFHLVVTHSHQLDQDLVEAILPREVGWLGMIGSRSKVTKFFLRFRAAGMDERLFSKLSAPVGLDIGAETPEEIAISIVAELVRIKRRSTESPDPLSARQLDARGGDGVAHPPALNFPE